MYCSSFHQKCRFELSVKRKKKNPLWIFYKTPNFLLNGFLEILLKSGMTTNFWVITENEP